ncbi:MAG: tetratricopeptide repeat protein [Pseudomonadota bacterium]|uniref:Tetratricopeptide repeat protein n=1 Tax=Acinetobacter bereziniae TaxID=106648 RepID=A0A8I1AIY8_ACIBZ|nr:MULTISPECIES: tetratricopeptide repeat protein [Acinetobacter]MEC8125319.1 tetratricopeptide repeat protein [Pseudomonadota bacterium]MBJ9947699.1 tetratricopeptide repeat protein [Acinetobacter bereziniae]QQC83421.1 tetratricopeptide repeat protein [Acinetobacter bereziniae]UUN99988.1 tetratricopeptide repeat protein [Acinetobacter bereziniae]BCX74699.1 hypothetical protein TOL5_28990 [Acinetobacter sp. Tol 5]
MNRNVTKTTYLISLMGILALAGCQTTPQHTKPPTKPVEKPDTSQQKNNVPTPDGVKITPYERPEIKREKVPTVIVPQQKAQTQKFEDGQSIPAFKQLMQQAQTAYQKQQWDEAERFALNAQRLAPQSAEVFSYLARIAQQKKQYANAESLARRGLSYAQTTAQKKVFWNTILQSAQQLKNQKTVAEASKQLQSL